MEDLEAKLKEADEAGARIKLIATDGVFSMDGIICNLKGYVIWLINITHWLWLMTAMRSDL